MPKDFRDWIEAYNQKKGWRTIVVPGGTSGAKRSPQRELESLVEESRARESKLAKEMGELEATVIDLVKKVRDEHRDLEKFRLENDLKIAQKKLGAVSVQHDIAQELSSKRKKLLIQVQDIEKTVRSDIRRLHGDMDQIFEDAEDTDPVMPGDESRKAYDTRRQEIVEKIDKVRDTPFTLRDPSLPEAKTYNGIGAPEYTLLHTLLQKGDAYAMVGENYNAMGVLDDVEKRLDTMSKARRGVLMVQQSPETHPEISRYLGDAQMAIAAIRAAGLGKKAQLLEDDLDLLTRAYERQKADGTLDLSAEELASPHEDFAQSCLAEVGKLSAFRDAVRDMRAQIADLRLLGDTDGALLFETKWDEHDQAGEVDRETAWVRKLTEKIRAGVELQRNLQLIEVDIDPVALKNRLDEVKKKTDQMFKHNRDGSRRQQTDSKSQQKKDVKKDKDIPREALDELAMRLKMADLLLESNSVEALKRASAYLDEVEKFQTDVDDNSSNYEDMIQGIKDLRSDFKKFEDRYRDYHLDRRSELKIAVDAFDKDYKKQPPETNKTKLKELKEKSAGILTDVKELKAEWKKFDAMALSLEKDMDALGEIFRKKKIMCKGKPVEGYWGVWRKDLIAARGEANKKTKDGITNAILQVEKLAGNVAIAKTLAKEYAKSSFTKMDGDEALMFNTIRRDTADGQLAHVEDEKAHEEWKREYPLLEKRLKKIKDDFKKLKLDMTDIDLAILDLEALETEQKSTPDWTAAVKKLQEMGESAGALERQAQSLEDFKAEPLDRAARAVVGFIDAFVSFVDGFAPKVKAADDAADTKYDLSELAPFIEKVKNSIPTAAIKNLQANADKLAKDTSLSAETRELREAALADVRLILGRLRSSAAIKHFANQPFVADETLDTAISGLERFQIKLLTSLK